MAEQTNFESDPDTPLRLAMAACMGVAALAKWAASISTNKDAAAGLHTVMRNHLGPYRVGTNVDQTFEAAFLRSIFGEEHAAGPYQAPE